MASTEEELWTARDTHAYQSPRSSTTRPLPKVTALAAHSSSTAERDHALSRITALEQENVALWDQWKEGNKTAEEFKEAKMENLRHLRALRWSTSTLSRMPLELLGEIFEVFVLDLCQSPWTLAQVSQHFRKVAFATRQIWTKISIDTGKAPGLFDWVFSHSRWKGGRETCRNKKELREALSRSGHASLDISIASCDLEMAFIIADECHRWIHFDVYEINLDEEVFEAIITGQPVEGGLASVQIVGTVGARFRRWIERAQPQELSISFGMLAQISPMLHWGRLRSLALSWSRGSTGHITPILTGLRLQLEELCLNPCEDPITEPIEMPQLVDAQLGLRGWWHIKCDKLQTLNLNLSGDAPPLDKPATYPNLQKLIVFSNDYDIQTESIVAPRLEKLKLEGFRIAEPGVNCLWLNKDNTLSPMTPKKLSIVGELGPWKSLIQLLQPYETLETFHLDECKYPSSFFKAFTTTPRKKGVILCPNLRDMDVDLGYSKFSEDAFFKQFKAIITTREASGHPLKRLFVQWPKPEFDWLRIIDPFGDREAPRTRDFAAPTHDE